MNRIWLSALLCAVPVAAARADRIAPPSIALQLAASARQMLGQPIESIWSNSHFRLLRERFK